MRRGSIIAGTRQCIQVNFVPEGSFQYYEFKQESGRVSSRTKDENVPDEDNGAVMDSYIFQLNCSDGGVPKRPVREAELTLTGLACDSQAKRKIHGGPERALCLYALEHITELQEEGHPIFPGSVGENVTVVGLEWTTLMPGSRLALGDEVIIEITSYTTPCPTIAGSFLDGKFKRISQKKHPGGSRLYAKVIRTGRLATGQTVRLL